VGGDTIADASVTIAWIARNNLMQIEEASNPVRVARGDRTQ